jgi:ketosteroid isomerase-like protein
MKLLFCQSEGWQAVPARRLNCALLTVGTLLEDLDCREESMSPSPREIAEEAARRMVADAGKFADLFAVGGVLAWPFRVPGMPPEIRGREVIRAHFRAIEGARQKFVVENVDVMVRGTDDPEVVIIEMTQHGQSRALDSPCSITTLSVVRVRDGEIVRYDDYVNPIWVTALVGREHEVAAALARKPTPQWAIPR